MYEPLFNVCLVRIDDRESAWGGSKDDSAGLLGQSYNKGTLVELPYGLFPFGDTHALANTDGLVTINDDLNKFVGKHIMWSKGHEGENTFEHNGDKYALVFWWDIVGVKVDDTTPEGEVVGDRLKAAPDNDGGKQADIDATRATLKKHGVPNADNIDIVGGGEETDHLTGIR
jgi:hypothetical protein